MFACLATFLSLSASMGAESAELPGGSSSSAVDHDGVGDIAGCSPPRDFQPALSEACPRYPRFVMASFNAVDAAPGPVAWATDANRPLTDAAVLAATRDRRRIVAPDMWPPRPLVVFDLSELGLVPKLYVLVVTKSLFSGPDGCARAPRVWWE